MEEGYKIKKIISIMGLHPIYTYSDALKIVKKEEKLLRGFII